jgi:hypothetical protein
MVPYLKIDFEKAYDKVKWDFHQQALRMNRFPPNWCNWIARFVQGRSVEIRVNDDIGHYFHTLKGRGKAIPCLLFCSILSRICLLS